MRIFNRNTTISIIDALIRTKSVSVGVVIDKSEHDKIISDLISLGNSGIYNEMRNTFRKDGELYLLHNVNSNITGKSFDHLFFYKNVQNNGSIKSKNTWFFE
jgi:hypothetical protein